MINSESITDQTSFPGGFSASVALAAVLVQGQGSICTSHADPRMTDAGPRLWWVTL